VHIAFGERICWFCACKTQVATSLGPVENYIGLLEREICIPAQTLPAGIHMRRVYLSNGTPTILLPALFYQLLRALKKSGFRRLMIWNSGSRLTRRWWTVPIESAA